jgi:hypothetical protein
MGTTYSLGSPVAVGTDHGGVAGHSRLVGPFEHCSIADYTHSRYRNKLPHRPLKLHTVMSDIRVSLIQTPQCFYPRHHNASNPDTTVSISCEFPNSLLS